MSKSLLAIGGLGAGACLLLSLMMQHALQAQQERKKEPLAEVLELQFEGRRVGPVHVTAAKKDGKLHLAVKMSVRASLQKQRIADSVGVTAWTHALATGSDPATVTVEVGDDQHGAPLAVTVPRPQRRP